MGVAALRDPDRRRSCTGGDVVFCDVDGFKLVNGRWGHKPAVVPVAERLQAATRATDTVARFAGDEFVVVCPALRSSVELDAGVERVARTVHAPERGRVHPIPLHLSIGAAPLADGEPARRRPSPRRSRDVPRQGGNAALARIAARGTAPPGKGGELSAPAPSTQCSPRNRRGWHLITRGRGHDDDSISERVAVVAALALALAVTALAAALASTYELRRRRELVARACHELRGPLTAVRLSLATMERRSEAPPERLAILDLELRRAGLALDDFAAARSGRRVIDRTEPVEIAELLEEQFDSWYAVAGAFDSHVALGTLARGAVVNGDRLRLAQAVSNLVANALEHGPGRVELTARLIGQRHVRIEVIDEGPGLPAPVAELTRRARAGRGRRGRGLAIAAEIAERHGGRLVAAPTSRGARIGLELPFLRQAS